MKKITYFYECNKFYPIDPSLVMLVLPLRTPKNPCFHPCMKHTCISPPSLLPPFIFLTSEIHLRVIIDHFMKVQILFVAESIYLFCVTISIQNSLKQEEGSFFIHEKLLGKKRGAFVKCRGCPLCEADVLTVCPG